MFIKPSMDKDMIGKVNIIYHPTIMMSGIKNPFAQFSLLNVYRYIYEAGLILIYPAGTASNLLMFNTFLGNKSVALYDLCLRGAIAMVSQQVWPLTDSLLVDIKITPPDRKSAGRDARLRVNRALLHLLVSSSGHLVATPLFHLGLHVHLLFNYTRDASEHIQCVHYSIKPVIHTHTAPSEKQIL